jgi:hypothetical protein
MTATPDAKPRRRDDTEVGTAHKTATAAPAADTAVCHSPCLRRSAGCAILPAKGTPPAC